MTNAETVATLAAALPRAATPEDRIKLLADIEVHAAWAVTEVIAETPRKRRDWDKIAALVEVPDVGGAKSMYDPDRWVWDTSDWPEPDDQRQPWPDPAAEAAGSAGPWLQQTGEPLF
jgi:hypothetical protein